MYILLFCPNLTVIKVKVAFQYWIYENEMMKITQKKKRKKTKAKKKLSTKKVNFGF